jgi:HAD superfamily hydrolase (TIGR01450 family)
MNWVLDLDGVVWLADTPLPGAAEAVAMLRDAGERVLFATNNSGDTVGFQEAKLARFGIPAEDDVVTSAQAAAFLVEPGQRVLATGGPGVTEALLARGAEVLEAADAARQPVGAPIEVDAVVVGIHLDFDYGRLRVASQAVREGARLIATNGDSTYPTPEGQIPGGGAIAAAVAYAAGVEAVYAGKPEEPIAQLIHQRLGDRDDQPGIMVGDRPSSDGAFAKTLGYRFGLVLTGVTHPDDLPVEPTPDLVATDLLQMVEKVLASS